MVIIFSFSQEPAEESGETSGRLIILIGELFNVSDKELFALRYEVILRKCAHVTEYMILAAFLCGASYRKNRSLGINMALPVLISALYACSDEFHQLYVPGRDGNITDVFIDTAGAAVSTALITFIRVGINRKNKER